MFNAEKTLWDGTSIHNAIFQGLWSELVPAEGMCSTVEGELLRAVNRVYHDFYNNGFGNNWSGAYNFLDKHLGLKAGERKLLKPYSQGKIVNRRNEAHAEHIAATLEGLVGRVIAVLLLAQAGDGWEPNSEDMHSLQEKSTLY